MDLVSIIYGIVGLVTILVTIIASWILGKRMRRRIRKTLGAAPKNEMELTSLKTWMDVESIEERNQGGKLG